MKSVISLSDGCPETPFHFGVDWSSATLTGLFLMRIAGRSWSKPTNSGRLLHHYYLGGTANSSKY